ncbi:unnamed protein product [Agarophyton chilense]
MLRQRSWSQRIKTALTISSFVLKDVAWWLSEGIWHIPSTLSAAKNRTTFYLAGDGESPALDIYAPSGMDEYVLGKLHNFREPGCPDQDLSKPIVLYVHGGAWGSGHPSHYSQLAAKIVDATQSTVFVLSYGLYPKAVMSEQAEQVTTALLRIRFSFPSRKVIVVAHSSGAHITSLALLKEAEKERPLLLADVVMFTAGPFHLMHHFLFESHRGIALVSPMLPAALAETDHRRFDELSPTIIAERFPRSLESDSTFTISALEGALPAKNIYLPDPRGGTHKVPFPKTYIMTSTCDTVVPMYSSLRFAAALRKIGLACDLLVYDFVAHTDWVLDWSAVTRPREKSDILDIDKSDHHRRMSCIAHLGGKEIASLMKEDEQSLGTFAQVRDILRVIKAVASGSQANQNEEKA